MLAPRLAQEVQRLSAERQPFVVATVVRTLRPTSVRPGDSAVVRGDGTIEGFVGGMCAESSVRLHSLKALETGEPLLLKLIGSGDAAEASEPGEHGAAGDPMEGALVERNPCLSGGSLEIFLDPQLPAPRLVIVGGSPTARAVEQLALAAGYDCARGEADEAGGAEGVAAVIVASHGNGEEAILADALTAGVPYVALVASRRRGEAVRADLGVPRELGAQLHTPAGLDLGARTPMEIAISILAELVAAQHADPAPGRPPVSGADHAAAAVAVDPVCGMRVAMSAATPQLEVEGETVFFCGPGCRDSYAREHADELAR